MAALTFFHWRRVPVRVSWLVPVAALVLGGFGLHPGTWLGYLGFLLLNLSGQLRVLGAMHARPSGVVVGVFGAHAVRDGSSTLRARGFAAWGGVAAQGFVAAMLVIAGLWPDGPWHALPEDPAWRGEAFRALTTTSFWFAFVSMLPIPLLPGFEAWLAVLFGDAEGFRRGLFGKRSGGLSVRVSRGSTPADDDDDDTAPTRTEKRTKGKRGRSKQLAKAVKLLEAQVEVTQFLRQLESDTRDEARKAAKRAKKS